MATAARLALAWGLLALLCTCGEPDCPEACRAQLEQWQDIRRARAEPALPATLCDCQPVHAARKCRTCERALEDLATAYQLPTEPLCDATTEASP